MANNELKYIWRCARCTNHFANITKTDGVLKQEKKCPKCKSINFLTITNDDIYIHCRLCETASTEFESSFAENYA